MAVTSNVLAFTMPVCDSSQPLSPAQQVVCSEARRESNGV